MKKEEQGLKLSLRLNAMKFCKPFELQAVKIRTERLGTVEL
jgi:hypothetical protein